MSNGIKLSPKYGVNPTISVCFWCGKSKNEIAMLGHIGDGRKGEDKEAPMYAVLDYEPCDECKKDMAQGFTVLEATIAPNGSTSVEMQEGVYPTGRYAVIKTEAATQFGKESVSKTDKAFLDSEVFQKLFADYIK